MNFFETTCMGLIFILFPLYIYLFYIIYNVDIGKKDNNLLLDFALWTSFYLSLRFGILLFKGDEIFLFNTVLLIAYLKKRTITSLFLSVFSIFYYTNYLHLSVLLVMLIYSCSFILYIFYYYGKIKKNLYSLLFVVMQIFNIFYLTFTKGALQMDLFSEALLTCFAFCLITTCAKFLFESGESMIRYHHNVKLLKEEKQVRDSLFKITHEIKNPIAVCKGYLDMFDINQKEHSEKYIPIIKKEIERTLLLLEDFLSMNKIKIEKDILDINLLLEEISNHFELLLKEKGVDGIFDINDEEVYIMGDYNRIVQVFINLVKNSIEAIGEKESGFVKLYTKQDSHFITIYIEDNGCGMTEEDLNKIKEPFFTTKRRGTGLGVSLSDEIIRAHDGVLTYESKEGKGTKVSLQLPILKID